MKKITLFILCSCQFLVAYSQFVVEAPTLEGLLLESKIEAVNLQTQELAKVTEQTVNLQKTLSLMEKAEKSLTKVSNFISGLNTIKKVYEEQRDLIVTVNNKIRFYKKSKVFNHKKALRITTYFNNMLLRTTDNYHVIKLVLSKGKMSDYERMKLINESSSKMREIHSEIKEELSKYDKEIQKIAVIESLRGLRVKN